MEVERSMATRKEDAESIIGEIAEELEEEAKVIGKSQASEGEPEIVVKSDDEAEEPLVEEGKHDKKKKDMKEDDEEVEDEKKKKKKEEKAEVEKSEVVTTAYASDVMKILEEIKSQITPEPAPAHPLDIAFSELKSVYDEAVELPDAQEALQMVQEPFEALAAVIQNGFAQEEPEEVTAEVSQDTAIAEAISGLREEMGLLRAEITTIKSQPQDVIKQPQVPQRRSVNPALLAKPSTEKKSETPKLRSIVEKSVGYNN
jgi:hypothetical protein